VGNGRGWQESGVGDDRWYDVAAEWAPEIVGLIMGKWTSSFKQHYFKLIYRNLLLEQVEILYIISQNSYKIE